MHTHHQAAAAACCSGRSHVVAGRPTPAHRRRGRARLAVSALLKPAEDVSVSWRQSTDEVFIKVPVAADVRGRDVAFEVHPKRLSLAVAGTPLLSGSLEDAGAIKVDDCFWVLDTDEAGGKFVSITLAKAAMGFESWPALLEDELPDSSVTHRVALDVRVGDTLGRLVLGLYGNVAPKAVENFRALVSGEGVSKRGTRLSFKGSPFHRIIPGFMAQGGDITLGNGMGGESIFGETFEDEAAGLRTKHSGRGVLALANAGPDTNNSQFYISFTSLPHLDGKHVVLGRLEAGWSHLIRIEEAGTEDGTPLVPVTLVDCRELALSVDPQAAVDELQQDAASREEAMAAEFAREFDAAAAADAAAGGGASKRARPAPAGAPEQAQET